MKFLISFIILVCLFLTQGQSQDKIKKSKYQIKTKDNTAVVKNDRKIKSKLNEKKESPIVNSKYSAHLLKNENINKALYGKMYYLNSPSVSAYSDGASPARKSNKLLPFHKRSFEFEYVVKNNEAIYQGDIVLGNAGQVVNRRPPDHPKRPNFNKLYNNNRYGIAGSESYSLSIDINNESCKWFYGIIPYELDPSWTSAEKSQLISHIDGLDNATNLTLVPRNGQSDYIYFKKVPGLQGGSSPVGRQGGCNTIKLGGTWKRTVIHEILHSAGFWHEQCRSDRSNHVEILRENIKNGKAFNFNMHREDGFKIGPYDKNSIMHYGGFAFGKENSDGTTLPTIIEKSTGNPISRASNLSRGDIDGINFLYPRDFANYVTPPLSTLRMLKVNIKELEVIEGDDNCGVVEFFPILLIGDKFWGNDGTGNYEKYEHPSIEGRSLQPNWKFSYPISKNSNRAKIRMILKEEDGGWCGADDYCDINPINGEVFVDLLLYLDSGQIWISKKDQNRQHHYLGQIGEDIMMEGFDSKDHDNDDTVKTLIKFEVLLE